MTQPTSGGKVRAHLFGVPFGRAAGKKRDSDDADESPERDAERAAGHQIVDVGTGRGLQTGGVARANQYAQKNAQ